MTGVWCLVFLFPTLLWTRTRADTDVSCVFMESCILPCSFHCGSDVIIHWIQTAGNVPVHSHYNNQDQLSHQAQRFRYRTSLFKDQIIRGNISLLLTGIQVQDQATYKCYCDGQETQIVVKVDAPVNEIDLKQEGNTSITCSSEGIYPQPELTWSTNPPSDVTFNTTTRVQQTEQQLYNISSSLILSEDVSEVVYSCTVTTRRNKKTATLLKQMFISGSDTKTLLCTDTQLPFSSLIWRFNHSQVILSQTGADVPNTVSVEWRRHVKSVSESGSLTLQHLTSSQAGTYTCELSNAEETHIRNSHVSFTRTEQNDEHSNLGVIIGVVTGGVVIAVAVVVVLVYYCQRGQRDGQTGNNPDGAPQENLPLKNLNQTAEPQEENN